MMHANDQNPKEENMDNNDSSNSGNGQNSEDRSDSSQKSNEDSSEVIEESLDSISSIEKPNLLSTKISLVVIVAGVILIFIMGFGFFASSSLNSNNDQFFSKKENRDLVLNDTLVSENVKELMFKEKELNYQFSKTYNANEKQHTIKLMIISIGVFMISMGFIYFLFVLDRFRLEDNYYFGAKSIFYVSFPGMILTTLGATLLIIQSVSI